MGLKTDLAAARTEHAAEKQAMKDAADAERCEREKRATTYSPVHSPVRSQLHGGTLLGCSTITITQLSITADQCIYRRDLAGLRLIRIQHVMLMNLGAHLRRPRFRIESFSYNTCSRGPSYFGGNVLLSLDGCPRTHTE